MHSLYFTRLRLLTFRSILTASQHWLNPLALIT
jgi:hypothetical protein